MLKKCWVTNAEIINNLVSADVVPRKNDEQVALEKMIGMSDEEIRAEENSLAQQPIVSNEVYEAGLRLTLRMADTGNEFFRFLSLEDINEMVYGSRSPVRINVDLALEFGCLLMQRSEPMTIAILDSSVNLNDVRRVTGMTGDALTGDGSGISSIPRE